MNRLWICSLLVCAICCLPPTTCHDEMEDFPLDAEDAKNNEAAESAIDETSVEKDPVVNDRMDLSGLTSSKGRITLFNQIMTTAMQKPGAKQKLSQVLPIIRAMSPSQRLTLATLVLKQLMSKSPPANFDFIDQSDNKTAELMIPISLDIASIFNGLGKEAESGRSSVFGTYYYNPLSAGYRVNGPQPQRPPPLYSIRRFQLPNSRRKDDVPPEMMPPPYSSPSNVSYANFNKHSAGQEEVDDEELENSEEEEEEEAENDNDRGGSTSDVRTARDCLPYVNNLCLDVNVYPSKDILNSIRNLEQKHVFRALVEDFTRNVTLDNPEMERRLSNEENENLPICASKVKYARPKKAKSMHGNWKFVVNTERYTQTVRIETCLNADKSCSYLNENVKSHCTQIYNYHRLLTWDEKSGLSLDLFKIPTCCSCQIQHVVAFTNSKKYSQRPDVGLQENVIADEPTVFHPAIAKPKSKSKPNGPLVPKRDSFNRPRRPPAILPVHHDGNDRGPQPPSRYSPSDNSIRRTSLKNNAPKGVYVPGKGTYIENAEVESTSPSHRVNYNYHPIIDFFKSTSPEQIDRADTIDEWQPMTEGPRSMPS